MANASLDPIKTRLNGLDPYHPADANTFADWSMEAGDVVTMKRGEEEYDVPVHSTRMTWKGAPQIAVNSTGSKEREAIANASKRKYGRGSSAMRNENYIYHEFTSSDGMLYSAIYMSESKLQTVFSDAIESVNSTIIQTASEIYSAVYSGDSSVYSYVLQTATQIYSHVGNVESDLHSEINQTAEEIYSSVYAADSQIYSYVKQTASQIYSHVGNVESDLHSEINQTAEEIYSSVYAADSQIYSYVRQTASQIYSHVGNVESDLHSEINQTADQIYSAVYAADSAVYSYVDQTATQIYSHVGNVESGLHSEINQTADQIYSSVYASDSALYSYVNQTASGIRQEVGSTAAGLQSSIDQQADRISLIVEGTGSSEHIKAAQIQAGIDAASGQSRILLSANNIVLDADVVAETFESETLTVENIDATGGTSVFQDFEVANQDAGGVGWSSTDVCIGWSVDSATGLITLEFADGNDLTFRKAAPGGNKINGNWSGNGTLAVGNSVTGYDQWTSAISVDLSDVLDPNSSDHKYYLQALSQDNDEQQPTMRSQTQYNLGLHPTISNRVVIRRGSGSTVWNNTAFYDIPLEDREITSNSGSSWILPTSGKVGISRVKVNVPSDLPNARSRFNVASGQYYIEAYDSVSLNPVAGSNVNYQLGVSGSNVQIQDSNGTKISDTPEYTIPPPTVNTWELGDCTAPYSYFPSVKVNGTPYTSPSPLNAEGAYVNGWTQGLTGVELVRSPSGNIGYGTTYTIQAKAYASKDAQTKTNVGSAVTITTPADNWQDGFDAGDPTTLTLGTRVTGTTYNVSIARGEYDPVGKTINLSNAYDDAREGYVPTSTGKAAATYNTSTSDQVISAGQYLKGDQTIKAVTTANIDAANIKYGVNVKVGDSDSATRIKDVTGTFTATDTVSEGQTAASASQIVSGYSAWVQGAEVKGSMSSKAAATYNVSTSDQTIASGQYLSGAQTIRAVTTSGIEAANIKSGEVVKVGDAGSDTRIITKTGTFTDASTVSSGQTAATADKILPGYSAWVDGAEVKGTSSAIYTQEEYDDYGAARFAAGCTNITIGTWTDTYSSNSTKRYTVMSGSGTSAVLAMSFTVKATGNGYTKELLFNSNNGMGSNRALTMAYRDGYTAGYSAGGGGSSPSYSVGFNSTGTFGSGTKPGDALKGWSPQQITGVPNSQNQTYRYIKFTVDGKQRSFYFS